MRATTLERFEEKVITGYGGTCWEWAGCRDGQPRKGDNPDGQYGRFALDGYHMMPASRASYVLFCGEIPKGLQVCHQCDNPGCVNPDHLFLGTVQDNADDMVRKGRAPHQQPGYVSPRKGTGKFLRIQKGKAIQSVVPKECTICNEQMYQFASTHLLGKSPVCSKKCKGRLNARRLYSRVEVMCAECGKITKKIKSEIKKRSRFYCSYSCVGKASARARWHGGGN